MGYWSDGVLENTYTGIDFVSVLSGGSIATPSPDETREGVRI